MLSDMPQFVPRDVCLSCDGCCRFKDATSSWRPKITGEEKEEVLNRLPLADKIFLRSIVDDEMRLTTVSEKNVCRCRFFDTANGQCRIYAFRPMECQLYPFLLARKEGRIYLAVHLNCPYIQEYRHTSQFDEHFLLLKHFFLQDRIRAFVSAHQDLAGDYQGYQDELEYLYRF